MAKLASIIGEHVKCDMFANNVAQFGHHVGQRIRVEKCSSHAQNIFVNICCSLLEKKYGCQEIDGVVNNEIVIVKEASTTFARANVDRI